MSFPLLISSRLPPCLSGLHHMNETAPPPWGLGVGGSGRGRHYHTVCLHQCTISIIGPVIETNHCLSVAAAQATHVQISFRLSRKLRRGGGINLWYIPNISTTIWGALGGLLYISMGDTNNLLEMYYITPQRRTKLATAQSDENKPNRTPQFHGDTTWCNEVTLWLPSSSHEKVQCHSQCKNKSM